MVACFDPAWGATALRGVGDRSAGVALDARDRRAVRQGGGADLLLDFMASIERHGSALAFPTRTVRLATGAGRDK
jgi:hypothetical protein